MQFCAYRISNGVVSLQLQNAGPSYELFSFMVKLGVPVTLVVPYGSEIHRRMWSRPGKIIVSCGKDINEVSEVKIIWFYQLSW